MNRILIAEDESRNASFVEKGLRANGFITSVVGDGDEALVRALSDEFDLLILDLGLPKRDGFSVLDELRGGGSTLPVLILTAQDGVPPTVRALDGGADDYVTKPFSFDELLARVRARLRPSGRAPRRSATCAAWRSGSSARSGRARPSASTAGCATSISTRPSRRAASWSSSSNAVSPAPSAPRRRG